MGSSAILCLTLVWAYLCVQTSQELWGWRAGSVRTLGSDLVRRRAGGPPTRDWLMCVDLDQLSHRC